MVPEGGGRVQKLPLRVQAGGGQEGPAEGPGLLRLREPAGGLVDAVWSVGCVGGGGVVSGDVCVFGCG